MSRIQIRPLKSFLEILNRPLQAEKSPPNGGGVNISDNELKALIRVLFIKSFPEM